MILGFSLHLLSAFGDASGIGSERIIARVANIPNGLMQ